jgi:hypothetical protein
MTVQTAPSHVEPDTGSPDDFAHYARKADIDHALVNGGRVRALCGVEFQPIRDPSRFPVCPTCDAIHRGYLGHGGAAASNN